MRVLAGDIGGTKTLLALADCDGNRCKVLHKTRYANTDFAGLEPMVTGFVEESGGPAPEHACFAAAGPVTNQAGRQTIPLTNLPWELDTAKLTAALGIPHIRLLNDLQSVGYGIEALAAGDLITLQTGKPEARAPRGILGAGTGLGQTIVIWQNDRYEALPTEGGHTDFAPQDADQLALLAELMQEMGHVSYERLLSGSGLVRIYRHLLRCRRQAAPPEFDAPGTDQAAAVSNMALQQQNPAAQQALDMFVRIYGAQAGNLALTLLARGGIYIAGGIAPKILPKLQDGAFITAFNHKGRMAAITREMPVYVIGNPAAGLLGAAVVAGRL